VKSLNIEQSDNAPKVVLDFDNGLIEFAGSSFLENTFEFYEPIIEWLSSYFGGNAQDKTSVNFDLKYYNSATTQVLFDIFDLIQDGEYKELEINWYYDGDDEHGMEGYEDYADEFPELNIKAVAL
jgi:hypothetical protein